MTSTISDSIRTLLRESGGMTRAAIYSAMPVEANPETIRALLYQRRNAGEFGLRVEHGEPVFFLRDDAPPRRAAGMKKNPTRAADGNTNGHADAGEISAPKAPKPSEAVPPRNNEARGKHAVQILDEARDAIGQRAAARDKPDGERSMRRAVDAFNAMFGLAITETQGWQFMALLKMSRASGGRLHVDDYIDQAAYAALAGECALQEPCARAAETRTP